jgi:hypothetical protein
MGTDKEEFSLSGELLFVFGGSQHRRLILQVGGIFLYGIGKSDITVIS